MMLRAMALAATLSGVAGFMGPSRSLVAPGPQLGGSEHRRQGRREGVVMMPIGVPKVAYRVPGAPSADWIDIYNRSVIAGLAIYDTMNHIKSKVVTINIGLAASMASFLLCGGQRGMRLALPHSRVMIHQPMGGAQGQAEDIKVEAAQIIRIKENLVRAYAMNTGQTQEQIIRDLDRDNFMSAHEAAEYGLIDKVIEVTD